MSDNDYQQFVGQTAKQIRESTDAPEDLKVMSNFQDDTAILTHVNLNNSNTIVSLGWKGKVKAQ